MTVAEWNERARLRRQLHLSTGVIVHTESTVWRTVLAERGNEPMGQGTPIPERVGRFTRRTKVYVAGPDRGRRGAEMLAQRIRMAGVDVTVGQYARRRRAPARCPPRITVR